jgi:hypothetical protein
MGAPLKCNTATERRCSACKVIQPLDYDHFPISQDATRGFLYLCRTCSRESAIEREWARKGAEWLAESLAGDERLVAHKRRYLAAQGFSVK